MENNHPIVYGKIQSRDLSEVVKKRSLCSYGKSSFYHSVCVVKVYHRIGSYAKNGARSEVWWVND